MMRCAIGFILLAFVLQAHAKEYVTNDPNQAPDSLDYLVDSFVGKVFDRSLKFLPFLGSGSSQIAPVNGLIKPMQAPATLWPSAARDPQVGVVHMAMSGRQRPAAQRWPKKRFPRKPRPQPKRESPIAIQDELKKDQWAGKQLFKEWANEKGHEGFKWRRFHGPKADLKDPTVPKVWRHPEDKIWHPRIGIKERFFREYMVHQDMKAGNVPKWTREMAKGENLILEDKPLVLRKQGIIGSYNVHPSHRLVPQSFGYYADKKKWSQYPDEKEKELYKP